MPKSQPPAHLKRPLLQPASAETVALTLAGHLSSRVWAKNQLNLQSPSRMRLPHSRAGHPPVSAETVAWAAAGHLRARVWATNCSRAPHSCPPWPRTSPRLPLGPPNLGIWAKYRISPQSPSWGRLSHSRSPRTRPPQPRSSPQRLLATLQLGFSRKID